MENRFDGVLEQIAENIESKLDVASFDATVQNLVSKNELFSVLDEKDQNQEIEEIRTRVDILE